MRADWELKKIGEIADVSYGYTGKAKLDGAFRYVRITDIDNEGKLSLKEKKYLEYSEEAEKFLLDEQDLLMARTGATFAKVLLHENIEPSIYASYLIKIDFKVEMLNKLYWYFTKSEDYWEQANSLSSGSAQPHFNGAALKKLIFTYPKSLPEQQQIVALLDEAFETIDQAKANIEKNIENAKELFQSKLDAVFLNKGSDWEEIKLGKIASVEYGYTDKSTIEGDFRYVRITDIDNNGKLISEDKKYIKYSKEAKKFILKDKDLLMARTGATFAKVLLHNDVEPSIFASYLIRINFQEKIENELYWYFSKSGYYWRQANDLSSGTAQPHFNGAALKQVIFSYPKSIVEQQNLLNIFSGFITETQEIEAIYNKKLLILDELKKSILQKAFAGELTNKAVEV